MSKCNYTAIANNHENRCEKCTFKNKLEYCETGAVVPRGCHKRNIYWATVEGVIEVQEANVKTLEKTIADARKTHKAFIAKQLGKIWKLRKKIVKLRKEMK